MSYDPTVDTDGYPAGYNAGYIAGKAAGMLVARDKARARRRTTLYFITVAIDYVKLIKGVDTTAIVERMEAFLKELKQNA